MIFIFLYSFLRGEIDVNNAWMDAQTDVLFDKLVEMLVYVFCHRVEVPFHEVGGDKI